MWCGTLVTSENEFPNTDSSLDKGKKKAETWNWTQIDTSILQLQCRYILETNEKKNPKLLQFWKSMVNRKNCTQIYAYRFLKFDPESSRSGGTLPIKAARKSLRFFHPPKKVYGERSLS